MVSKRTTKANSFCHDQVRPDHADKSLDIFSRLQLENFTGAEHEFSERR